jgi:predicted nucleotidyltransferase
MRVTRESLIRIAKETAQERAFNDRDIIAAYLTGSLVSKDTDPMLGGTADIDIIFVHKEEPKHRREFVKLTPDFHVDISHRAKAEFKRPRELRLDPWLGWEMYDPQLLFEREKFFEFVQAGLRAGFEFNAPAPALQRSRSLLAHGREIWRDLLGISDTVMPKDVIQYMKSLYHAVNAVAELSGPPLQERRLMLEFASRAETAGRPGMDAALLGLLGASALDVSTMNSWLPEWKLAYESAMESGRVDSHIHPARVNYYEKAIQAILESDRPRATLWPLLQTWTHAVEVLPDTAVNPWRAACGQLGLTASGIEERVNGLDHFLDEVEALLDELSTQYGLETSTSI